MNILLPKSCVEGHRDVLKTDHSLVVIGANGAGKSKFGMAIAANHKEESIVLSALHSLYYIQAKEEDENELIKSNFDEMIAQLLEEEYVAALRMKEQFQLGVKLTPQRTKLDNLQSIWQRILPHSRIVVRGSKLEVMQFRDEDHSKEYNPSYQPSKMSEGEKIVFYFICSLLFAKKNALVIIDEPEMHLHRSVMNGVWDTLEEERPDCTFVYLTNDISFAASRRSSKGIWIRSFNGSCLSWDYEIMNPTDSLDQEIYMEILGSRKPILFIEGNESSSIDIRLYPHIFPEYMVKPLGGCTKVIESTKSMSDLKGVHFLQTKGIVDRDRRTDDEVIYLRHHNVYVPNVAEIENFFLLPQAIKLVAERRGVDGEWAVKQVTENVINLFSNEIPEQAMLHVRHRIKRELELSMDIRTNNIDEYESHIQTFNKSVHPNKLYNRFVSEFTSMVENRSYFDILKVYNQKATLLNSHLFDICKVEGLNEFLSFVVSILKEKSQDAQLLRNTFKRTLGIIEIDN